ncbi:M24 family metallopeptidase [Flavihumibacter sp. R14]|nr:M24 family metallopeptidase [Flavihumibacter soli]
MFKFYSFLILACLVSPCLLAQQDLPTDYLPKEFHAGRRQALRDRMPARSVAVVFAFPEKVYSNDVTYPYHQNPDLYYFSGYKEGNSVLLVFKEPQKNEKGETFNELFFVQKRNPAAEQWNGRRLGVEGVKKNLGFEQVLNGESFKDLPLDMSRFDQVLFSELPEASDNKRDAADLYDLVKVFKQKVGLPAEYDHQVSRGISNLKNLKFADMGRMQRYFASVAKTSPQPELTEFASLKDSVELRAFQQKLQSPRFAGLEGHIAALREIKTPAEISLLKKAIEISCIGQLEVMKAINPAMSEMEIQGLHEYVHKKYGSESVGYPSIVGAGNNGCILHYIENSKTKSGQDMVLMDVGAEYHGYTADITRTIPANGKFTADQKAIYDIVYEAQEEVFKICKEGTPFSALNNKSKEVLAAGLKKLGIISSDDDLRRYSPHGVSHHLGLDVHDPSASSILKENMLLTVEPGIYIPENSPCDKKWWGIAVRLEDDVLIGKTQGNVLSGFLARKASDVEKAIAEKSVFDNLKLPALK